MNIHIDGPCWAGMWTEITVDALCSDGHTVSYSYHNRKGLIDRIALLGQSPGGGTRRKQAWQQRQRRHLIRHLQGRQLDILLSIQGHINSATVARLRQHNPRLKVIYWWGDILTAQARTRIDMAAAAADCLLVSYQGSYDALLPDYGERLRYFPFGVSDKFHAAPVLTRRDRKRYTADVAFVGSCYPERCELIHHLNERLPRPVAVWGRGWRHCPGVQHHGALSLADSLRVYRCARISLNLHHADTPNGCNMKFFEIPAAGGFQISDWQPVMDEPDTGKLTVACKTLPEFGTQIDYYLAHARQRQQHTRAAHAALSNSYYRTRLAGLLKQISNTPAPD